MKLMEKCNMEQNLVSDCSAGADDLPVCCGMLPTLYRTKDQNHEATVPGNEGNGFK